jgi:hypothetical protein
MKVNRNDPCPCGSGRKYKKCCESKEAELRSAKLQTGRFHFKAGSYGGPNKGFMPSIMCYKEQENELKEYYCLACPLQVFETEDEAVEMSNLDIDHAKAEQFESGSAADFGISLRRKGYTKVDDFKVIKTKDQE